MKELLKKYREEWAGMRPVFNENIELYRKGNAQIKVVDKNGNPIAGCEIHIKQKQHEFKFGCNALMLGQLGENNELYEEKFVKLFNLVTTTFCWSDTEPTPGELRFEEGTKEIFRRPPADRVRNFGKKYNIALKGQPLLADSWYPKWAPADREALKEGYRNYFKKVAERYGDDFYLWDVVNEAYLCKNRTPGFPLYDEELSFIEWAFAEANKLFPKESLLELNEASGINWGELAERYYNDIKKLAEKDVGLGSIGIQFHMFNEEAGIEHLENTNFPLMPIYEAYQRFSTLKIPMFITEITIPSKFNELSRVQGEMLQAEIIDNLYHLWFSIPEMSGIIYWNFKDGLAWKTEGDCKGCLLDENFYEKPSYQKLYQLIHREWRTDITEKTNLNGIVDIRGFYGDYEAEVVNENSICRIPFSILRSKENTADTFSVSLQLSTF